MPRPLRWLRVVAARSAAALAPLACTFSLVACQGNPDLPPCELSAALLAQVDGTRLLSDVQRLVDFGERRSVSQQTVVAAWIAERLEGLGYRVEEQSFTHVFAADRQIRGVNVEARRRGLGLIGAPWREVFLGAHFDSTSWEGAAPGALDNASGTAAVLEVARLLAPCATARDLRLVLFSKEESADAGSREYLASLARERDGKRIYLNIDMIGCAAGADSTLSLSLQDAHAELGDRAQAAVAGWTRMKGKVTLHEECNWNTDTGPFCAAGDQALQMSNAISTDCWQRIHQPEDTPDLLEREALVESTRAALTIVLEEAGANVEPSV